MHTPFVCAVFAICIHLQTVSQSTGYEYRVRRVNTTDTFKNESPFGGCKQSSPSWLNIDQLDVKKIARIAKDWMQNAWNGEVNLKLRILRNQQNDTLVGVQLKDADSTTENNIGRTFGIRRRMQLLFMLPISFKLGIIMTLLLVLTAVSLKTLLIGFVILLLLLHHFQGHPKLWGAYKTHRVSDSNKDIHIHIHTPTADHHPHVQPWHEPSQPFVYSA